MKAKSVKVIVTPVSPPFRLINTHQRYMYHVLSINVNSEKSQLKIIELLKPQSRLQKKSI